MLGREIRMENKKEIIKKLERAYKETCLDVNALVYYRTDDGEEYVDVMTPHLTRPWLTVNVTADSGVAMIYDVVKAIFKRI